jgi:colicin import membrane protein
MANPIKMPFSLQVITGSVVVVGGGVALAIDFINNTFWASHIGGTAMASAGAAAIGVAAFQGLEVLNGRNRLTAAGKWASLVMTVMVAALAYIGGMGDKMNAERKASSEYALALTNAAKGRAEADQARTQAAAYRKQAAAIQETGAVDVLSRTVANAEADLSPLTADAASKGQTCQAVKRCRAAAERRDTVTASLSQASQRTTLLTQAKDQDAAASAADAKAEKMEAKAEGGSSKEDVVGTTLAMLGGTAWGWAIGIDVILAMLQIAATQIAAMHIETGAAMIAVAFADRQAARNEAIEAAAKEAARIAKAAAKALKDAEKAAKAKTEKAAATRAANKAKKAVPVAAEKPRLTVVASNDNQPVSIRA